jgi:hypothetical protein
MPALDAVLAEPDLQRANRIVLTGDIAAGPQPTEVLDRLLGLGDKAVWVRRRGFQPLRLGADEPAPGLDRIGSPAADCDVEVEPVLGVFFSGTTRNRIHRPLPARSTMRSAPRPSSSSLTATARQ